MWLCEYNKKKYKSFELQQQRLSKEANVQHKTIEDLIVTVFVFNKNCHIHTKLTSYKQVL